MNRQRERSDHHLLIPFVIVQTKPEAALLLVPLLVLILLSVLLALVRYVNQRDKAITAACWHVITMEASRGLTIKESPQPHAGDPSHAGGVVFKQTGGQVMYLLVQARNHPDQWVLPKGHIESGEGMRKTASREVLEETGVCAYIIAPLTTVEYAVEDETVRVRFYLMEGLEEGQPSDARAHEWLTFDEALHRATHAETRRLLELAGEAVDAG